MKARILVLVSFLTLSAITVAQRQPGHIDPAKVSPDNYTVLLDNQHVRVVEYKIGPGEKDAWHTHPPKASYVAAGGTLRITLEGEDSFVIDEITGNAAWMGAVGPHFGENIGTTPIHIVLVEVKSVSDAPFEGTGNRD